ncbi:hypothetical protein COLO4_33944 [Corchorus olitorius]|uniref:Uncharacterized protein n=1 Tax=Corchorus olitorius TaxID=93759 RepID=A0A1R3GPW4_9ROSI|nr:hypothetical protein COLO4_33944 [Corchorus olitorius]
MFPKEESSWEIQLPLHDCNEEELRLSNREEQNFRSFRALKESSNNNSDPTQSSKPLIQRVPSILRENEDLKKYFEPRVVAIGPLHHGNPRLHQAEKAKLKLAVQFTNEHGICEHVLYKRIKNEIEDLKNCYRKKDIEEYEDEELAWMFFVDGCAVLHAIHYWTQEKQKELNIKVDLLAFAQIDLFMLENQLPFRLLDLLMISVKNGEDLRNSINKFINDMITVAAGNEQLPAKEDQEQSHHLLGLLRERLLVKPETTPNKDNHWWIGDKLLSCGPKEANKTFRSINELTEAGVCVIPSETSSLRDIHFSVRFLGTLKVPRIVVDDSTGAKFMNLVAYEMCPDFENDFGVTSYLCFLDSLIDTARDVKQLRHSGMLLNHMGSDEDVANLFNTITTDLVPDPGMYKQVTDDIRK